MLKVEFSEKDLLDAVEVFSSKLKGGLSISFVKEVLGEINNDLSVINDYRHKFGIYYFIQNEKVKYIGRALPSVGLRARILNQTTAFGDSNWDTVIRFPNTEIGLIIFEDVNQWYFISSLEHYLIETLKRPIFNKRG